jgi:hypothetical protein
MLESFAASALRPFCDARHMFAEVSIGAADEARNTARPYVQIPAQGAAGGGLNCRSQTLVLADLAHAISKATVALFTEYLSKQESRREKQKVTCVRFGTF